MVNDSELSYEQMICALSPNHSTFLKDGDPEKRGLTGESFFVVEDKEGIEWLLKEPAGGDIYEDDATKLSRVWRDGIKEVYASNIARYIGYPTATTKLVIAAIENINVRSRPFVAYEYLPDVKDVKRNMPEEFFAKVAEVENACDIDFRPVLNWLLGSHTDNGRQGVVSGTDHKRYYAIDMTVSEEAYKGYCHSLPIDPAHSDKTDLYKSIIKAADCKEKVHINLGICMTRFIDESNHQQINNYFDNISKLSDSNKVKSLLIPVSENSTQIAHAISERASAIKYLYNSEQFNIS